MEKIKKRKTPFNMCTINKNLTSHLSPKDVRESNDCDKMLQQKKSKWIFDVCVDYYKDRWRGGFYVVFSFIFAQYILHAHKFIHIFCCRSEILLRGKWDCMGEKLPLFGFKKKRILLIDKCRE